MPSFQRPASRAVSAWRSAGAFPVSADRLVRLRLRHDRVEVVVDEQPPDVLVRVVADELLDVDAAVAEDAALPVGLGDLRLDGDDALEPGLEARSSARNLPGPAGQAGERRYGAYDRGRRVGGRAEPARAAAVRGRADGTVPRTAAEQVVRNRRDDLG